MTVLAAGLGIGGLAVVHNSQQLDRQGKIVIAASNPQYVELATLYQEELRKFGVQVEVRRTTLHQAAQGEPSDAATPRGRRDAPGAGRRQLRDHRGLRQRGAWSAACRAGWRTRSRRAGTRSFPSCARSGGCSTSRSGSSPAATCRSHTLRDLKGKRILIGTRDSGGRSVARQLLRANGVIDKTTATFIDEDLTADADPLVTGTADAAILIVAADYRQDPAAAACSQHTPDGFHAGGRGLRQPLPGPFQGRPAPGRGGVRSAPSHRRHHPAVDHASPWWCGRTCSRRSCRCSRTPSSTTPSRASTRTATPSCSTKRASSPPPAIRSSRSPNEARIVYKTGELPLVLQKIGPTPTAWACRSPTRLSSTSSAATLLGMLGAARHRAAAVPGDPGDLRLDDPPAPGLLVPPAQGAGAQSR